MSNENIHIKLTRETIRVDEAFAFISSPFCGGTNVFIGTTRINEKDEDDKKVQCLFYEAYEEMAVRTMVDIVADCLKALEKDADYHRVFVVHRLGPVRLTEASLLIGVSSPHRSTSHQLVMDMLNRIKQTVPIWKKIVYEKELSIEASHEWSMKSEAFWLEHK